MKYPNPSGPLPTIAPDLKIILKSFGINIRQNNSKEACNII
jgi:hypothetical protein